MIAVPLYKIQFPGSFTLTLSWNRQRSSGPVSFSATASGNQQSHAAENSRESHCEPKIYRQKTWQNHPPPMPSLLILAQKSWLNSFGYHICLSDPFFQGVSRRSNKDHPYFRNHRNREPPKIPQTISLFTSSQCRNHVENRWTSPAEANVARSFALLAAHASVPQLSDSGSQWHRANSAEHSRNICSKGWVFRGFRVHCWGAQFSDIFQVNLNGLHFLQHFDLSSSPDFLDLGYDLKLRTEMKGWLCSDLFLPHIFLWLCPQASLNHI